MIHREASELLPGFAAGDLDGEEREAVRAHVEECSECRDWLASYGRIEEALGGDAAPAGSRPSSADLALCAVRPEEVDEPDRAELRAWLESDPETLADVELLRIAIVAARPTRASAGPQTAGRSESAPRRTSLALAAGIAAALFLGVWALAHLLEAPDAAVPWPVSGSEIARQAAAPDPDPADRWAGDRLADSDLEGSRLIESDGETLTVDNVKVRDGARITFRAGQVVAFGDGFQIGDGGSVAVEVRSRPRSNG